jgi:membrane-bound lytic murein transglycosylase B
MLMRFRRRALMAPAVILWFASIPVTLALASGDPDAAQADAGAAGAGLSAAAVEVAPPAVPARLDRLPHVSRATRAAALPDAAFPGATFRGRDGELITPERLAAFLDRYGSPMAGHAATIVEAGRRYRIDPRSIVAIAGVESRFGAVMPCYNAWGWGKNACRWYSWRQAILSYARVVSEAYPSLRHGDFATASRSYNPANAAAWAAKCRAYFSAI